MVMSVSVTHGGKRIRTADYLLPEVGYSWQPGPHVSGLSSLVGGPPKSSTPPPAANAGGAETPPGTLSADQQMQTQIGTILSTNAGKQFFVLQTPSGNIYSEHGRQVSQTQFESDYQTYISKQQAQGATKISTQPEFLPVDVTQSVADQVKYVQNEEAEIQTSKSALDQSNPLSVGPYNAQVQAYNTNVKTVTGEVQKQQQTFQSYVGKATPASQLVSAFQSANLDVSPSLAALARSNPNTLVTITEQDQTRLGKGDFTSQPTYVLKYQLPNEVAQLPSSGGGDILGQLKSGAGTGFGYLTEGIGYAGFYLYSLSYTAGGELGSLITGKPFQGVKTFGGQPLSTPTPEQAQQVGTTGLEGAIVINLAAVAPATLIGAGISVGFEEVATGGKASPGEILGAAAGGSIFAGVGYGISLGVLKLGGAYIEAGGPGAGYVENFLKTLAAPGVKAAAVRAVYGAATNVALSAPFTQDPTQLLEAGAIGAGTGGLLPGVVGTVKEVTGLGGVKAEELPPSVVEELGYAGKSGDLVQVFKTEPIENLGGKSIEIIGDVTVNPAPASELEKSYVIDETTELAHATLKPFFKTSGEVLLTAKPGEATGFRNEVESLGLYFAPSDQVDVIRAYGGYIGIGEGYSGESPKIVLAGKPAIVSIESEVSGEFAPLKGESAADVVRRTFGGAQSGKTGIPVENYFGKSTERQMVTPTAFTSRAGEEYPGTILETLGMKQKFYVKEEPEGIVGKIPLVRSLLSKYTFASLTPGRLKPVTAADLTKAQAVDLSSYAKSVSKGKGVLSVSEISVPASAGVISSLKSKEVSSIASEQSEYYSEPISKAASSPSVREASVVSELGSPSASEVSVSPESLSISPYSFSSSPVSNPSSGGGSPPTYPFPLAFPRKKLGIESKGLDVFGVRLVRNYLASSSKEINRALKKEGILE